MSTVETSRAAVLARIQASSKDAVVLEEMQRQGFWPREADSADAALTAELIAGEQNLLRELNALQTQLRQARDPEAALKAMRKKRMADALRRREETRRARAKKRHEKALAWHERRARDIIHLGAGVSRALADTRQDAARLAAQKLPLLDDPLVLAQAIGIGIEELRFLTYQREVSRVTHYRRFDIPKKSGGLRRISAPMPRLKRAQYWVLDNILARLPVHEAAHGFVPGRSIVSNATPHAGQAVVVNFDLRNFFPSILYKRVLGLFQSFGYSRQTATLLALLCTEQPCSEVGLDGLNFFVRDGERHLPQGAPSSPAITNLLCRRLDKRLSALARRHGFRYTRYADDMTFSADASGKDNLPRLLWQAKRAIAEEGFDLHPDKQRIMRGSARQEVTGIVVNHHPTPARETLRRFRAVLFQVQKDGPNGKSWNGNKDVINALAGYARFVRMVDPAKGEPLCRQVAQVSARWGGTISQQRQDGYRTRFRAASAAGRALPGHDWKPVPPPPPQLEQTAEQLREAKQAARREAVEREAATQRPVVAANPPPRTEPTSPAPTSAPATEDPLSANDYVALALQLLLMLVVGLISRNPLLFLAALGIPWLGRKKGNASWLRWAAIFFACNLLWRLLLRG